MADSKKSCSSKSCDNEDDSYMVSCELCNRWWHYACHNFDPKLYDTNTPWFCGDSDCNDKTSTPKESVKQNEDVKCLSEAWDHVDNLLEAAVFAQAAVAQRDKDIAALKAELDNMKLKLSQSLSEKELPSKKVAQDSSANIANERLAIIRKIQDNHQSLLTNASKLYESASHPISPKATKEYVRAPSIEGQDMTTLLTILNRNNVQELPSFSGENKREWPYFEEVFKSTTIEGKFSDKENVARLRKALKGEAYQLVSDRLKYSTDANAIMDSLRAIFGRYDVLVHDLTTDLLSLPKLTSNCDPRIRLWAVKVNGYVADVKSINREEDLTNGYVMTNLASKLGAGLYQEWQRKKVQFHNANFVHFAEFLNQKILELPPDLLKTSTDESRRCQVSTKAPKQILTHQNQPIDASVSVMCKKCNNNQHPFHQCISFKALTEEQRLAFVKDNMICFTCLDPLKHNWRVCARKRTCGKDGCSGRHHPLLHQPKNVVSALNSNAQQFIPPAHVHSSHLRSNSSVIFKIVPIRLHGKDNRFVDTYAFFDDGSSLTMLEKDLFDEIDLEGSPEELTLQWTKGVVRRENSLRTTLEVSGVKKSKHHFLRNVFTVKNLDLPSQSIDASHLKRLYPHLRGLPLLDLVEAKPKILIGLDQASFLLGHGQRYGKDEEPCAFGSPISSSSPQN